MNNGIKRLFEIVAAIVLGLLAFQILGFLFSAIIFAVRLVLSLVVFGAVVSLLDWALFRRGRRRIAR